MNSKMFYTGFAMMAIELGLFGIFLLTTLDYSWFSMGLLAKALMWSMIGLFNIAGIVLMVIGGLAKE